MSGCCGGDSGVGDGAGDHIASSVVAKTAQYVGLGTVVLTVAICIFANPGKEYQWLFGLLVAIVVACWLVSWLWPRPKPGGSKTWPPPEWQHQAQVRICPGCGKAFMHFD